MKLSEFKKALGQVDQLKFILPDGSFVPLHFHITEVGSIKKNFVDCGGTVRKESVISFQLWEAEDYDHRLSPQKLMDIINISESVINIDDQNEIEVEYQSDTIGKFGLSFDNDNFLLTQKFTDCLAKDNCGIPDNQLNKPKQKLSMASLGKSNQGCDPQSGCC